MRAVLNVIWTGDADPPFRKERERVGHPGRLACLDMVDILLEFRERRRLKPCRRFARSMADMKDFYDVRVFVDAVINQDWAMNKLANLAPLAD